MAVEQFLGCLFISSWTNSDNPQKTADLLNVLLQNQSFALSAISLYTNLPKSLGGNPYDQQPPLGHIIEK